MEDTILENGGGSDKDISQCKAKLYSYGDLVICLVQNEYCKYQMMYAGQKYCIHPQKKEIAIKTEQVNQK